MCRAWRLICKDWRYKFGQETSFLYSIVYGQLLLHYNYYFSVDHGSWFDFTKSWWDLRNRANVLIVYYEDMKRDLKAEVAKLCRFLGKNLPDDLIDRIADHCQFESMKRNPMTNHLDVYSINSKVSPLLRKGIYIYTPYSLVLYFRTHKYIILQTWNY